MSSSPPIRGLHLVRYGIPAEHKYLLKDFYSTYDQLIFNGTIVAHMPAAIASFLALKAKRKPYFIDPQTHAFQHSLNYLEPRAEKSPGELKHSVQALVDHYGDPLGTRVGKKGESLIPGDLAKSSTRTGFCRRVLRFQAGVLANVMEASDTSKYYKYLEKKGKLGVSTTSPSLLVAPYFYLTPSTFENWLDINLGCIEDSRSEARRLQIPLAAQIVISRDALTNTALVDRLVDSYASRQDIDLILVWIDRLTEQRGTQEELEALVDLLKRLGQSTPIVNLYGGFFSVMIARLGIVANLSAIAHGLEYGEERSVVPVGGGIPTAKYYLPALHSRLPFRSAVRAIRHMGGFKSAQEFYSRICDCAQCKIVIQSDPEHDFAAYGRSKAVSFFRGGQLVTREFPLPETRENSVKHYMWRKSIEYTAKLTKQQLMRDLEAAAGSLARVLSLEETVHCVTWARVLKTSS